jgi:hypothetical protein
VNDVLRHIVFTSRDKNFLARDRIATICLWLSFKAAYDKYVELGFPSLSVPEEHGGQGLPGSLATAISEMVGAANWAWGMYPGLSHGAVRTIEHHGSAEQKATYLPKLVSGEWTGTMCLTESHAGSDLGIIRSKAEPQADGSYAISGEKIFISAGEHDMAENIVHIVLARLPGAPKGTKRTSNTKLRLRCWCRGGPRINWCATKCSRKA